MRRELAAEVNQPRESRVSGFVLVNARPICRLAQATNLIQPSRKD